MVRTKTGTALGRVVAIEVDEGTGRIAKFLVSGNRLMPVILDNALAIAWEQVIDWQADEITVTDAVVREGAMNVAMAAPRPFVNDVATPATPSVQMSEQQ